VEKFEDEFLYSMAVFAKPSKNTSSLLNLFEFFDGKISPFQELLLPLVILTKIHK